MPLGLQLQKEGGDSGDRMVSCGGSGLDIHPVSHAPSSFFTRVANSSNSRSGTSLEGLRADRRCLLLQRASSEPASEWLIFKTRS